MLSKTQIEQFNNQGYLILKGAIDEMDIQRLEQGVANNPPLDGTLDPNAPVYPNPGRYTLATQSARDPDLLLDDIHAGYHLRDRMLDLEPGVHLQEEEPVGVPVVEELHGAGAAVVDRRSRRARAGAGVPPAGRDRRK